MGYVIITSVRLIQVSFRMHEGFSNLRLSKKVVEDETSSRIIHIYELPTVKLTNYEKNSRRVEQVFLTEIKEINRQDYLVPRTKDRIIKIDVGHRLKTMLFENQFGKSFYDILMDLFLKKS